MATAVVDGKLVLKEDDHPENMTGAMPGPTQGNRMAPRMLPPQRHDSNDPAHDKAPRQLYEYTYRMRYPGGPVIFVTVADNLLDADEAYVMHLSTAYAPTMAHSLLPHMVGRIACLRKEIM